MALITAGCILLAGRLYWLHVAPPVVPAYYQTIGGDFTLNSADGPVSLHDLRGKVLLVYFGYTHCPDACPAVMTQFAAAFDKLPQEERKKVAGIFISIDPARDTPPALKSYVRFFHPQIIGLTGRIKTIIRMAKQWGVSFAYGRKNARGGYLIDHSSTIYLVNPQGRVAALFKPYNSTPGVLADAIRQWLPWAR